MKKNIGLVGYSPASVNALNPLIDGLLENYNVRLMVLSEFAELEWKIHIENKNIEIYRYKYYDGLDLVIYNTGSGGDIELEIPLELKEFEIKCLSIQDIFWDSKEGYVRRYKNVPDYLIVSTELNKKDVLEVVNIESDYVKVLGNPHFDRLKDFSFEEEGYLSVSFISQCGTGGGLNEPTADNCKVAIYELVELLDKGIITDLKIYKHPRENKDFYREIGIEPESTNNFVDMMRSGIIISCGSTPHYEAMLIGKRTLFCGRGSLKNRIDNEEWDTLNLEELKIGKSSEYIINYIKGII